MSVSLYYQAARTTPMADTESAAVTRIVTDRAASFPYEDEERLTLYNEDGSEPDKFLAGSTKLPTDPVGNCRCWSRSWAP